MKQLLEKSKYLVLIGIASLLLASLAAFGWGALKTYKMLEGLISGEARGLNVAISLIELVDGFLIAVVLYIFAVSLYELFIGKLDVPEWMLAHNLHELKTKLGSVMILVMAVKFLEHLVEWKDPTGTLLFACAIAVVSGALIALSQFGGKD